MPTPVNVFGTAKLQVAFFTANQSTFADPVDLGFSENGVEPEQRGLTNPVHSDEYGGQQGVPFDVQVVGEMHILRLALTRFDPAVLEKLWSPWSVPLAEGMMQTPGKLIDQDLGFFRLAYGNNNVGVVYPKCTAFTEPKQANKGTRHEIATIGIVARPARISTVVSQVETLTYCMYKKGTSLANAWTLVPGSYS